MAGKGPSVIALIPARSASKRVPDKNIRALANHPLLAYTVASALQSEIFPAVVVSTDSERYAEIARYYGAEIPFLRPAEYAADGSPDIEWVEYTLGRLREQGRAFECFSILRPTSPFRTADTIRRAWREFLKQRDIDSLRAVQRCKEHPGKMWILNGKRIQPLLSSPSPSRPWHSSQYVSLPAVYVQNASLELAFSRVVFEDHTIAGKRIMPFFTEGSEGFDLNTEEDWVLAEHKLSKGEAALPRIAQSPIKLYG